MTRPTYSGLPLPLCAHLRREQQPVTPYVPLQHPPQAYLLLDASDSLQPLAADMGRALEHTIISAANAILAACGVAPPGSAAAAAAPQPGAPGAAAAAAANAVPLSAETAAEAMSAAALCDVLLQLFPPPPPGTPAAAGSGPHGPVVSLLGPALRAMAALLAHPAVPSAGVNVKVGLGGSEGYGSWGGWLSGMRSWVELVSGDAERLVMPRW